MSDYAEIQSAAIAWTKKLTEQNKNKLLPCPFCGGTPQFTFEFLHLKLSKLKHGGNIFNNYLTEDGSDRTGYLVLSCENARNCGTQIHINSRTDIATRASDIIVDDEAHRYPWFYGENNEIILRLINRWNHQRHITKAIQLNGLD